MTKGRKRKPSHLHVVQGTARKDRTNPNEPEPSPDRPVAPDGLNNEEVAHFDRIVSILGELGYASSSHVDVITTLARRQAEIDGYSKTIDDEGPSYETFTNGGGRMIRMRPEVAARSEAMRHAHGLLAELGLSPASMSKVSSKGSKKKSNPFGQLG